MTATNGDGIEEDLTRAVGMAMIAASRAGEQMARMRQTADRERQARAAGDAARAQRELAAHTEAARAYFEVVTRPEYLTAATDEQIRDVARQAQAWTERLPEAQRAAAAATGELGARRPAPDTGSQRAAVLAGQAEAADQRAAGDEQPADGAQPEPPQGWDRVGKYYGHDGSQQDSQQQGQQAAATAANAQARPAREAPAAGRTTTSRQDRRVAAAASPANQHPEVGR
jgi:hypothetical protein